MYARCSRYQGWLLAFRLTVGQQCLTQFASSAPGMKSVSHEDVKGLHTLFMRSSRIGYVEFVSVLCCWVACTCEAYCAVVARRGPDPVPCHDRPVPEAHRHRFDERYL